VKFNRYHTSNRSNTRNSWSSMAGLIPSCVFYVNDAQETTLSVIKVNWNSPNTRLATLFLEAVTLCLGTTSIDTSGDSGTSTLETYYSNFIARQLCAQKCLKYRKSQYWHADHFVAPKHNDPRYHYPIFFSNTDYIKHKIHLIWYETCMCICFSTILQRRPTCIY